MISLKLNGKTQRVKPFDKLSLEDYKFMLEMVRDEENYTIFHYIAWQLDYNFDIFLFQKVGSIKFLNDSFGRLKAPEEIKPKFIFRYKDQIYNLKGLDVRTKFGYRALLEQYMATEPNVVETCVFLLATILNEQANNDFDYERTLEIANDLEQYNGYQVVSLGAFFLKKLKAGESNAWQRFKVWIRLLIKNTALKKGRGKITLKNIP